MRTECQASEAAVLHSQSLVCPCQMRSSLSRTSQLVGDISITTQSLSLCYYMAEGTRKYQQLQQLALDNLSTVPDLTSTFPHLGIRTVYLRDPDNPYMMSRRVTAQTSKSAAKAKAAPSVAQSGSGQGGSSTNNEGMFKPSLISSTRLNSFYSPRKTNPFTAQQLRSSHKSAAHMFTCALHN